MTKKTPPPPPPKKAEKPCNLCTGLGWVPKNIYTDEIQTCPACNGSRKA